MTAECRWTVYSYVSNGFQTPCPPVHAPVRWLTQSANLVVSLVISVYTLHYLLFVAGNVLTHQKSGSSDGELIYIINFDRRHGLLSTKRTTLLPPPGARRRCDCLSFYGRGQRALEEGGEDALRSPNVYMYGLHLSLRSYSVACRVRAWTNMPALHARAANTPLYYGWRLECCLSHWSLNGTARLKVILRYKIKSQNQELSPAWWKF